MGGGLVEEQQGRLLGEGHGHPDALALAAGQLVDGAPGQLGGSGRRHRGLDRGAVGGAGVVQEPAVREAAASDEIRHGDAGGGGGALRQQTDDVRGGPRRHAAQRAAVQQDGTAPGDEQPGEGAQQRRLPAAVGPDDDGERAVGDVQVEPAADLVPVVGEGGPRARRRGPSPTPGAPATRSWR